MYFVEKFMTYFACELAKLHDVCFFNWGILWLFWKGFRVAGCDAQQLKQSCLKPSWAGGLAAL